jgi:hypothetical protein
MSPPRSIVAAAGISRIPRVVQPKLRRVDLDKSAILRSLQPTNFRHLTRYQGAVSYPGTISGGLGQLLNDNATDDPVEQETMKAMLAFFDGLISSDDD